jgi:hypothetical protein
MFKECQKSICKTAHSILMQKETCTLQNICPWKKYVQCKLGYGRCITQVARSSNSKTRTKSPREASLTRQEAIHSCHRNRTVMWGPNGLTKPHKLLISFYTENVTEIGNQQIATVLIDVSCVMATSNLAGVHQCFERTWCFHLQGRETNSQTNTPNR